MIKEQKEASSHHVCASPCTRCQNTGMLENKEVCPSCGGTGCTDLQTCNPAGGLECKSTHSET